MRFKSKRDQNEKNESLQVHNPLSGGHKVNLNSTFLVIFPMSPSKYG
jgi:hypothetical protein